MKGICERKSVAWLPPGDEKMRDHIFEGILQGEIQSRLDRLTEQDRQVFDIEAAKEDVRRITLRSAVESLAWNYIKRHSRRRLD